MKGCQVCRTWPMVVPGGAWTSIWSGKQTESLPARYPGPQTLTSLALSSVSPHETSHPHSLDHLSSLSLGLPSHLLLANSNQKTISSHASPKFCRHHWPAPYPSFSLGSAFSTHLLEATRTAAAATVEGAEQAQHLSVPGVHQANPQGPAWAYISAPGSRRRPPRPSSRSRRAAARAARTGSIARFAS